MKVDLFKGGKMDRCYWEYKDTFDYWLTDCGEIFCLDSGTPSDNEMKYCCYCGKELEHE